jgi:hypothetical protein
MEEPIDHQFTLFGHQPPSGKVPISAERIRAAAALIVTGDDSGAAEKLREVREKLEAYEKRISNGHTRK